MSTPLPPIYRDIRRLLVHTEEMVRRFSRYHKYTVGTDLRTRAMQMMRGVNRACFDTVEQARHVQALVWLVDDYKLTLQLAMEVGAYKNAAKGQAHFNQFEEAANLAATIGKQCGSRVTACGNPAGSPRFTECLHRLFAVRGYTMIKPCYLSGCVAALQVCRLAFWSASPNVGNTNNAWNVTTTNGNVNNNNRNNSNHVRLVRAGEWSVTSKASQRFLHPKGVGNPHPTLRLGGLTPR